MNTDMEIRHLGRETRTALEIAIVSLAPSELVDRLALVAGLLAAIGELPADSAPAIALAPKTIDRAQRSLADWRKWEQSSLKKASA